MFRTGSFEMRGMPEPLLDVDETCAASMTMTFPCEALRDKAFHAPKVTARCNDAVLVLYPPPPGSQTVALSVNTVAKMGPSRAVL